VSTDFTALNAELEKAKAQAQAYAQDVQRMGRERVELLHLLGEMDELRARVAVKNATIADLRAKLKSLESKYDKLIAELAHV
jgi:uncharacterized coiled-coil DUF342 family protein